jgi:hypothetical protein
MKTINLTEKTSPDGRLHLDIQTGVPGRIVEIVVVINEPAARLKKQYDFRDVIGKLHWKGDALSEQRRLRDEW